MLDSKIEKALNKQVNHEMAAAYNYFAMAAWCEEHNLTGFARWFKMQRAEELVHAGKLYQYVLDRRGSIELEAVGKPPKKFKDIHEVFEKAFKMEQDNTKSIYELYRLAREKDDFATQSHLQWFIDEQVEEEKVFDEIKGLLELAGDDRSAMLMLNQQLGSRATAG
jgi:ferritin